MTAFVSSDPREQHAAPKFATDHSLEVFYNEIVFFIRVL